MLNRLSSLTLAAILVLAATATHSEQLVSHETSTAELTLATDEGFYVLTLLHDNAIRVDFNPSSIAPPPSRAISPKLSTAHARLNEENQQLVFGSESIQAVITPSPFSIKFLRDGETQLTEVLNLHSESNASSASFSLTNNEVLMGGGSRVLGVNRRGHRLPLYNRAHYGFETHSEQMYYSLPLVLSDKHYAILWDNPSSGWLDLDSKANNQLNFNSEHGSASFVIITGGSLQSLVRNYVKTTGYQPLPPRWSLGLYASRFGYHSEHEARKVVSAFAEHDFPLDAIVLDLYWFGKEMKGTMGNLEWDTDNWPTPEAMIADFQQAGVNTVLITEPFILTSSAQWDNAVAANALAIDESGAPKTFDFYFGNTGLVDVFSTAGQNWFAQVYKRLAGYGVTGWWGDLGEPEVHPADSFHLSDGGLVPANAVHNAYGHQWAQLLDETLRDAQPNQRPFIMMRAGYAGSQRFGLIPWTGDVNRTWGGLQSQIELSLQAGLQGLAYMHSDIGGFAGGDVFDPELYVRWFQYGVFQPVLRPHAQENIASEPVFHDSATQALTRPYAKLRYRLLPYLYTLSYLNSTLGDPMMRPMSFISHDPNDLLSTSQYLYGDAFLVHPITADQQRSADIKLPSGSHWYDFWSSEVFSGGQTIKYEAPITKLPLLVRGGSFITMTREDIANTSAYRGDELDVHFYFDPEVVSSSAQVFEDDGLDPNSISNQSFELIHLTASHDGLALQGEISSQGKGYAGMPEQRNLRIVIHGINEAPAELTINGASALAAFDDQAKTLSFSLAHSLHTETQWELKL
ncbi:TIM-barrel domain-containing protein [Umboniibacter marinipuniceus]|uniref:Oligosaccharide 4-alpha-D-glucosyltransferase n=1 Tax=Umboniibacter marinipuniceus TaxID=569599 RepID=A0A3M0A2X1_9GAMM|nr:TIM-barrel domain-containing protein [Umboniibacter marinipuniceus]RMA78794.1 oligosaccharide 4-alpha-D-glucosyltransferase [Umboniibacter marinipuniceus]